MTELCLNKNVEIESDNNQGLTYGRTAAIAYYEAINVNESILDNSFADTYRYFVMYLNLQIQIGHKNMVFHQTLVKTIMIIMTM
jgi:hypothetical protein